MTTMKGQAMNAGPRKFWTRQRGTLLWFVMTDSTGWWTVHTLFYLLVCKFDLVISLSSSLLSFCLHLLIDLPTLSFQWNTWLHTDLVSSSTASSCTRLASVCERERDMEARNIHNNGKWTPAPTLYRMTPNVIQLPERLKYMSAILSFT